MLLIIIITVIISLICIMFQGSTPNSSTVIVCAGRWVPLQELWTVAAPSDSPVYTWVLQRHHGTSHWYHFQQHLVLQLLFFFPIVFFFLRLILFLCLVPCHGHTAPAWLWPFKCAEYSGATGRPCALQGRDGGVELFRSKPVWGGIGEIRQGFQRHSARLCES